MSQPRVLIAEDEEKLRRLMGMLLANADYKLTLAADGEEARRHLEEASFDLVITDLKMPRMDGMALVRHIHAQWPELPVIVITAFGSIESAVEAMQAGAIDYLTKPFEEEKLKLAVERGLRFRKILAENRTLRKEVASRWSLDNILTSSPAMLEAIGIARRVAASNANVIIYGESGTGKELVTRGIHHEGPRRAGPFVAINCAAIPDNLLESELFGHERGSFTGATERKPGKFELADGGTLFLDEVGDLSPGVQAKVLRAIETREIQRVGGTSVLRVDVRFIAATNKDLPAQVAAGHFRQDLYFRLSVLPITLPPLRTRPEDIMPLAEHFLETFCAQIGKRRPHIPPAARERLLADPWVGNVRELQNTIERAVILLQGDELIPGLLRKSFGAPAPEPGPGGRKGAPAGEAFVIPESGFSLEEHEKMLLRQALERTQYRKTAAARLLGLTRATLRYRMEKFGLEAAGGEDDEGPEPDAAETAGGDR